ncbi:MAG: IS3 family transposase, partial [Anaeroglobus sp.]
MNKGRYGYRRITIALHKLGIHINHKVVMRIMKEENQGEEQYRKATGHVSTVRPLLDQFANSYKQWLDSSQMDV